jgi:23S rRNA-/tRNA-specific pseudouridylate synthase
VSAAVPDFRADLPLGRGVRVIAQDENGVLALAKPAGVLSHPNSRADEPRALLTCAYEAEPECFVWPGPTGAVHRLWLLNRLDSATSGVILAASGESVARAIRQQFARRQVHKRYQALVFGVPRAASEVWRDRLAIEKRGGTIRTRAAGNLPVEARCIVLSRRPASPPLALMQLEPRTGRSHQLRVQCARHGLPIVGDQTYGDFRLNREFARATGCKRLFLHSVETRFSYERDGRVFAFAAVAPLPEEFAEALG